MHWLVKTKKKKEYESNAPISWQSTIKEVRDIITTSIYISSMKG